MRLAACGHAAQTADGALLVCDRPIGHVGLHEQRDNLADGVVQRTNWGDDGLAAWATTDEARLYGRRS